ncbi:glycosyltransferase family 4 protein [Helicobacter sp. MIT 05-5293]|uniref:glycosyltransferase family 4 protein n=1 Tax=Helicobacter sp. MIT 05-5293 TaxID=1548149 RepID=UPI0010FD12D1|nr:glycosyltransferase family 4 protein [Helicobacter sp. MIT 05-5293]TLD81488.1 glycosyltransferase family 4 protein [Helicobacter sp. MIT 05-5293]
MKILLTIGDVSIVGGAERVCVNLANAFNEMGHQVEILSFYKTNETLPFAIHQNIKLHIWHNMSESRHRQEATRHFLTKLYYKNFYKLVLNFQVAMAFKDVDAVITNDNTFIPYFKHKNTRYAKLIHCAFAYHSRNRIFQILVVLTSKEIATWKSYFKDVRVIPNFIPYPPPPLKTDISQHRILSIGRMDKGDQKGFLRLIDIWAKAQDSIQSTHPQLKDWQLTIVGGGELKETIETKITEYNLQDSIILRPFTQNTESEYLQASIYAMSSHYEGLPMVLLEASSYALPCVAFDVKTGPSDIIESGKSGYLIEDNDLESFAQKLIELMNDESKRKAMGLNARQKMQDCFSKEAIMPLWEALLKDETPSHNS